MKWTKEKAIAELENLAGQASVLQGLKRNCEEHIRWIVKTRRFLAEIFGEGSTYFATFASFTWSKQGGYMIGGPARPNESFNPQLGVERVNQEAFVKELGVARSLLLAAKDELEEREINEVYKESRSPRPEHIEHVPSRNYWHLTNPFWWSWEFTRLIWKHTLISFTVTLLGVLAIDYSLAWQNIIWLKDFLLKIFQSQ